MSEVYDRYVDTAGNYHYTDIETGHHVIPNTAVGNFPPPQTIQTNADRIRNMTDEELVEWLYKVGSCPRTYSDYKCDGVCMKCTLDWLKEEMKDDTRIQA